MLPHNLQDTFVDLQRYADRAVRDGPDFGNPLLGFTLLRLTVFIAANFFLSLRELLVWARYECGRSINGRYTPE